MAVQTLPAFTPDGITGAAAIGSSQAIPLPGTPASDTIVRIANNSATPAAVKLGNDNTVTVTTSTGVVVPGGGVLVLALASGNTYLAIISCGGQGTNAILNIATGN